MMSSNIWASFCVSSLYTTLRKAFFNCWRKNWTWELFLEIYFYRSGWCRKGKGRVQLHSSVEIYISASLINAQSKLFWRHILVLRLSSPRSPSDFMIGWRCQNEFHNMRHKCTLQVYWHVLVYNWLWKLI